MQKKKIKAARYFQPLLRTIRNNLMVNATIQLLNIKKKKINSS